MNKLKITVVSDTHYYSKKNGIEGKAFMLENNRSTNLIKDSEEVLKAFFNQIADDKSSDIVLISGDLTKNGEPESHKEFMSKDKHLHLGHKHWIPYFRKSLQRAESCSS